MPGSDPGAERRAGLPAVHRRRRRALKENGKTVDETTQKGRANLRALYALAGAWNNQSDATKTAQGSLRAARSNFIEVATAMGLSKDEAQALAEQLLEIKSRDVNVNVNTGDSESNARSLKEVLDSLRSKSLTVAVHYQQIGNKPSAPIPGDPNSLASGGRVSGPGDPTDDKVPAMLSNGEFVMRAAAVDMYGLATMHSMNALQLAAGGLATRDVFALASGGTAMAGTRPIEADGWELAA